MYDVVNLNTPVYVQEVFSQYRNAVAPRLLRSHRQFVIPTNTSAKLRKSTVCSSVTLWENLPDTLKSSVSRNSFKYQLRIFKHGKKNLLTTSKLDLNRELEIIFNRTKCDLIFKCHLFAHNFPGVTDSACPCGFRSQTTQHLLLNCPLFDNERLECMRRIGLLPNFNLQAFNRLSDRLKVNCLLYGDNALTTSLEVARSLLQITSGFLIANVEGL